MTYLSYPWHKSFLLWLVLYHVQTRCLFDERGQVKRRCRADGSVQFLLCVDCVHIVIRHVFLGHAVDCVHIVIRHVSLGHAGEGTVNIFAESHLPQNIVSSVTVRTSRNASKHWHGWGRSLLELRGTENFCSARYQRWCSWFRSSGFVQVSEVYLTDVATYFDAIKFCRTLLTAREVKTRGIC